MTQDSFFDAFAGRMNRELLKHAAGTWITCPRCGRILDWSTIIIMDVFRGGEHLAKSISCTHCSQALDKIDFAGMEFEHKVKIEITSKDFNRS